MLSTASARSAARSSRLAAARDYAAEVVQHAEQQDNLGLEDKMLGNLSAIVIDAIDCFRSEQPFRSSSLSMLSLELLSYLRQPNKPMLVNFACSFAMLMSELEGVDLAERGGAEGGGGGPRSYSNSIPDVPPEAATAVERAASSSSSNNLQLFSSPSTSSARQSRPPPAAAAPAAPPPPAPQDAAPRHPCVLPKEEEQYRREDEEEQQQRTGDASFDELDYLGKFSDPHDVEDEEDVMDEDMGGMSATGDHSETQNELLQRMFASMVPGTSSFDPATSSSRSDGGARRSHSKDGRFESRDDELVAAYNLPLTPAQIEQMPDHEMSRVMKSGQLTETQRIVMRQIRKRARSKISSREYRRRKEARRLEEALNASVHSGQ